VSATPDPRLTAVTLDVGGVLTLPPLLDTLARHGVRLTPDELLVAHHRGVSVEDERLARTPDAPDAVSAARRAMWAEVADASGAHGSAREATIARLAEIATDGMPWSVPVPGATTVVNDLTAAGFAVAIVSNSDGTVERQLATLGVCQVGKGPLGAVSTVVDSAIVGVRKPDPAIFEPALAALGAARSTTAHVGDTVAFDVRAAEAAGLVPVHFDASRRCSDDHAHLTSLADLTELLLAL
jgi:putative hydrolase of the HAD superfamily